MGSHHWASLKVQWWRGSIANDVSNEVFYKVLYRYLWGVGHSSSRDRVWPCFCDNMWPHGTVPPLSIPKFAIVRLLPNYTYRYIYDCKHTWKATQNYYNTPNPLKMLPITVTSLIPKLIPTVRYTIPMIMGIQIRENPNDHPCFPLKITIYIPLKNRNLIEPQ